MWLRLPGLPLPCQNPAILEVIGNSFGRFLRLDDRTKKLKHPMSPRMCVEMDLAAKLPEEVVIAIGTEDIFHQKIVYDLRIGFCTFCHLQGHLEANCRRRQSQGIPPSNEPSASSPQGNNSISTPIVDVVGADLPAGTHKQRARGPIRPPVNTQNAIATHPPPVCVNAPSSLSPHPGSQIPPTSQLPSPVIHPALPTADPQASHLAQPPQSSPQISVIPPTPPHPPQAILTAHLLDSGSDNQPLALNNQFALLTDDIVIPQQPDLEDPNPSNSLHESAYPSPILSTTISSANQPLSAAAHNPNASPFPAASPNPLSQNVSPAPDQPALACIQAAQAFLGCPVLSSLGSLNSPLVSPPPTLSPQFVEPILALWDAPSEPPQLCSLNKAASITSSFESLSSFSASPGSIYSAPKKVQSSAISKKAKGKANPKGTTSATKKGALPPFSS
ncbi:hypothetical protein CFOL_v3_25359 [Cephalotus follicularis]|uniref:DUF4283 domain-containing protein n=1 Tax=Cephalotus follicularis TaxID=3775 RepID=A0A1Q3CNS4_CEPFO|nr:hypothetical protein CFOL_v3_25359 [Cephalotus follicularis]